MITRPFTVSMNDESPEHDIVVKHPSFDEATDVQKRNMWDKALKSVTIDTQTTLRAQLAKGVRGEALNAIANKRFNEIINSATRGAKVTDYNSIKPALSKAQVDLLTATGVVFINVPNNLK